MKSSSTPIRITAYVFWFVMSLLMVITAFPQDKYESSGKVFIILEGTSNVHDWHMNSDKGVFNLVVDENNSKILALKFTLPVESLKSEHAGLDKNTYKALRTKKYATINFVASDVTAKKVSDRSFIIKSNGKLTISGVTKDVLLSATASIGSDNTITYSGSYSLNMTDYEVEPPTIMLGAIKTGNGVTIKYNMLVKGKNYLTQLTKN